MHRLWHHDKKNGQSLAEYGVILALVACVCFGGLTSLGGAISTKLPQIAAMIGGGGGGGGSVGSGGGDGDGDGGGVAW